MDNPRKATDVLLDLETKISQILDVVLAMDMNMKIMSNKIKDLEFMITQMSLASSQVKMYASPPQQGFVQQSPQQFQPQFQPPMQMIQQQKQNFPSGFPQMPPNIPERNIPVIAELTLPQEDSPKGFRRTSRPETFTEVPPVPSPKKIDKPAEVIIPRPIKKPGPMPAQVSFPEKQPLPEGPATMQGQIPVMQRCVDKTGKSIFLANVFVIDMSSGQEVVKTRTNATGKWMTSLPAGNYQVTIKKEAALGKDKVEAVQDVRVAANQDKLELPMLIIK